TRACSSPTARSRTSRAARGCPTTTSRASSSSSSRAASGRPWRRAVPDNAAAPTRISTGFIAGVRVVFARETGAYFDSSIAYVYAAVFLLLAHGIFMNSFFLESVLDLGEYFRALPFLLALF